MNGPELLAAIKASADTYYVYVLRSPDGVPFYVGVGTGRRALDHAILARRSNLDSHKLRVIRKIWRLGKDIDYTIHAFFRERSFAEKAEATLIAEIGRRDIRTGVLTNVTAGGEGAPHISAEAKLLKSIKSKEAWAKRDKKAAMAYLRTPEVRAKTAATRTGLKRGSYTWTKSPGVSTPEARAAASARLKADPVSKRPGVAAKISASKLGKPINSWMRTEAAKQRFSRGAHPRARPIQINGQSFACKQDAVDGLAVSLSTIDNWLKRGQHGARFV